MNLRRLRADEGNILISTILVAFVVGALASLTLVTGENADRSSTRDRNHDIALGVTEAGISDAMSQLEQASRSQYVTTLPVSGSTQNGTWSGTVVRQSRGFIIDITGASGHPSLARKRHVQVTLMPPEVVPDGKYALFSKTSIDLKNNDEVLDGDIWADNGAVIVDNGVTLNGSVTSAQSWVQLNNGSTVTKFVTAGGYNCEKDLQNNCTTGWAIKHEGAKIGGDVKASVSAPTCPTDVKEYYKATGTGVIDGSLTTWASAAYPGEVKGGQYTNQCTVAPASKAMPTFTFNPNNYDPATYHQMTPAEFNSYSGPKHGTFYVPLATGVTPSQATRLNMSNWGSIDGDTTIVTDYPVYTSGITDTAVTGEALFVVVSHYLPTGGCEVNHDDSDCAIHAKNHFTYSGSCKTAVLLYADQGAIAVKNESNNGNDPDVCGAYLGAGIEIKDNQKLTYDPRVDRVLGFGPSTYVITRWEELRVS